jgi:uncharacterized protein
MKKQIDIRVAMRDGVELSTDVIWPDGDGPWPAILWRTPYSNTDPVAHGLMRHVNAGYVVVSQDCRGRYDSAGKFDAFKEAEDGCDTIAWVRKQAWCDGRVGMVGASYSTTTQWAAAWTKPEGLKAIVPRVMSRDLFKDTFYVNGVFALHLAAGWSCRMVGRAMQNTDALDWATLYRHLPLESLTTNAGYESALYKALLAHPTYDDFWKAMSVEAHYGDIDVPALHMGGWYDIYAEGTLRTYEALAGRGKGKQRLVVGPWAHSFSLNTRMLGQIDFGPNSTTGLEELEARWLTRFVRGEENGVDKEPPVRIFVMGINQWREEDAWPLKRAVETPCYLASGGRANTLFGDGQLISAPPPIAPGNPAGASDGYTYHPENPVPAVGGNLWGPLAGPQDHSGIERRDDVLVYTGPVLEKPLEVTGYVNAVVHVSSDAVDTDFVVRLCDVYPDGRSMIVCDGVAATRFREGLEKAVMMTPGDVYELKISLGPTSIVFLPGHRLRVEITSSCFPRFARSLNTGEPQATGTRMQAAKQKVHHTVKHPSRLVLPVVAS